MCCTAVKNLTLKLDEDTYRNARIRAAAEGTSISAMVKKFLMSQENEQADREAARVSALDELCRLADARAKTRSQPLQPLTRDEIYAERLR